MKENTEVKTARDYSLHKYKHGFFISAIKISVTSLFALHRSLVTTIFSFLFPKK